MLDADGDFNNASISTKQATLSGTVLTFKNINLANNQYFGLITSYNFDLSIDETIPLLTATNRPSYPVSGTCTSTTGDVTLTIKGTNYTVACVGGIYSTNLNLASLSLGVNYDILATQTSAIKGPITVASTILAIPNISKVFSLGYKKTATPVTLTWNIDNRSETALAAWGFADALPAGMVVAPTPNATSDCLGTFA